MEDRAVEITAAEQKKRMKKNEDGLRDLWDNINYASSHTTGIPEGKERKAWKYVKT